MNRVLVDCELTKSDALYIYIISFGCFTLCICRTTINYYLECRAPLGCFSPSHRTLLSTTSWVTPKAAAAQSFFPGTSASTRPPKNTIETWVEIRKLGKPWEKNNNKNKQKNWSCPPARWGSPDFIRVATIDARKNVRIDARWNIRKNAYRMPEKMSE